MNWLKKVDKKLLAILILGIFLRLVANGHTPPALNWDEVSHGYNAYSILKTGKDEWGEFLPTIFKAYGDYKLPVYIYLTALSEKILGLSTLAVRLPSILAGIGIIIFTFLLAKNFFGRTVALFSAFFVSIAPWSLFLSRAAFEANLSVFFILAATHFFVLSFKKSNLLPFSAFFFGLSVWTYNSARIFVPLLLLVLVVSYKKDILKTLLQKKKTLYPSILILAIFFIPMMIQLASPTGQARYAWVSIVNEGAIAKIEEARNLSQLPFFLNRLINNRVSFFLTTFVKNWTLHYSPYFLFFSGGNHFQFSVPMKGLLYSINLPFLLIGLYELAKKKDNVSFLFLSWFFLAAIPSSLTADSPHALRSAVILPVPMIFIALGIYRFYEIVKRNRIKFSFLIFSLYFLLIFLSMENYLKNYFTQYRQNYSWSWQYGYEEAVLFTRENYQDYDKIIFTKKYGEPHEFILFYWPWDPKSYQSDPHLNRFFQTDWYWVDGFDKFYFVNDWQVVEEGTSNLDFRLESGELVKCSKLKCLLITSPGNAPSDWNKLKTVNFLDGVKAFEIYENN